MNILIVEDQKELAGNILAYFKNESYTCEVAPDYLAALQKIETFDYDCIILDITLPGGSGLDLLTQLKENQKTDGVLIISAKNSINDRVEGLNMGADDYLVKPFHLSELASRVAAIIRRRKFSGQNKIEFHEIVIDTLAKQVCVQNRVLELTRKEYQLLVYLVVNKGKVVSKNALVQHLWGDEMDYPLSFDFVYTHIKNLRKKLQDAGSGDYIKSVYGMGYKLTDL